MNVKIIIKTALTALGIYTALPVFAQTPGFVQQDVIKIANVTTDAQINSLSAGNIQTTRTYIDGLGRSLQTVMIQASPVSNKDIVQPQVYNALGQQTIGYLPYVDNTTNALGSYRSTAVTDQYNYYHGNTGGTNKVAGDDKAYNQQVFENSPLQRVLQSGGVGTGFQPGVSGNHWKTANYRSNTTADAVWNWDATGTKQSTNYAAQLLTVTEGTDENGKKTTVFADLAGRTLLKRQQADETVNGTAVTYFDTYYVYNQAGQIMYIIPPKAVTKMIALGNYSLAATPVNELVFQYTYDTLGRLIIKKVPGATAMSIVYDPLNRPVLLQDANLKANNKWNYIKYDVKGRVVSQGIYVDGTYTSQSTMQGYVSGLTGYSSTYFESRLNTGAGYYSNSVFPTAGITPLAYSYYDDYDFNYDSSHAADYSFSQQGYSTLSATTLTRGMVTGVTQKTVGTGMTAVWLTKVVFYDKNGRPIQVRSNNVLNATVADYNTVSADFTGKPVQVKSVKTVPAGTTTVVSSFSYDNWSRPTAVDQQYTYGTTTSATFHIAKYVYNEMGQLIDKQLGATTASPGGLQSVDYRYNIRGQLTSINNSRLGTTDSKNDDTNDIFGMELLYDVADANITGSAADYTGRISAVKWMSKNTSGTASNERSYYYAYDEINRLKGAIYGERTAAGVPFSTNAGGFDEKTITYDENGNILGLQRNQLSGSTVSSIDALTYGYDSTYPNRLLTVTDAAPTATKAQGFNQNGSGGSYAYYASGNLQTDPYKGISLTYNDLNRTDVVTVTAARSVSYVYDASGAMIHKKQTDTGTGVTTTTDYIDGFVYINGTLSYLAMPEGRVLYNGGSLKPEYIINDNQGNARVSFTDNGTGAGVTITQETSFYSFGLAMSSNTTTSGANKNLYNGGSEWQNDFANMPDFYQTFYRNYDAAIGRWMAVDPEPESGESMSPYHYSGNNPVMFNDPMGNLKIAPQDDPYVRPVFGPSHDIEDSWAAADANLAEVYQMAGINTTGIYDYSAQWDALLGASGSTAGSIGEALLNGDISFSNGQAMKWNPYGGAVVENANDWVAMGGSQDSYDRAIANGQTVQLYSGGWEALSGNGGGVVTDYYPIKYGPGPFNGALGVQINVGFNGDGLNYSSYNWIQVISKSSVNNGAPEVDDKDSGPSHYPFYYSTQQAAGFSNYTYELGKFERNPGYAGTSFTSFFNDGPAVHEGSFAAQLTLVGINANGSIVPIFSLNYGFSLTDSSLQRIAPTFGSQNAFTQGIINSYNQNFK
jgi:RHS repeat-associated protein